MKKLKLVGKEMLTKEQMKKIGGGLYCDAPYTTVTVCINSSNNPEYGHMAVDCDTRSGSDICNANGYTFIQCGCYYNGELY